MASSAGVFEIVAAVFGRVAMGRRCRRAIEGKREAVGTLKVKRVSNHGKRHDNEGLS